jgi:methylmalonyl-CoA/ethylmalonyl-CoA epimerase
MPGESFGLSTIGQIALSVHDVEKSTAYYRDVLGMRFLFAFPGLAFFDCDGVRLMLTKPEEPDFDRPGSVLYFKVKDIASAHITLRDRGVSFIDAPHLIARMPDHELWMVFLRDPDGNTLALMEERR